MTLRIVLMGTGPFAVPSFERIRSEGYTIPLVVTRPAIAAKSRGGPPPAPVRDWAAANQLDLFYPASINDDESLERLRACNADLYVVCDYGQILSADALAIAPLGGINLHGSLLPKYRGAAPVQWSVLNGDAVTGASVLHMTPRLDAGPILASVETPIQSSETSGQLEERLSELGVEATIKAIKDLASWDRKSPIGEKQDSSLVCKAPRLAKTDGVIDWGRAASEIQSHVYGMQPWPVAFTYYLPSAKDNGSLTASEKIRLATRIQIRQVVDTKQPVGDAPCGEIRHEESLCVACGDHWLSIEQLQPAGKKAMSGLDWARGNQPNEGSRFFS